MNVSRILVALLKPAGGLLASLFKYAFIICLLGMMWAALPYLLIAGAIGYGIHKYVKYRRTQPLKGRHARHAQRLQELHRAIDRGVYDDARKGQGSR